ncbi:MAG: ATPase [Thermodesulfobacteriota bacterium]|nr:ATPase [Thermodesulfobacteriota bacterium]
MKSSGLSRKGFVVFVLFVAVGVLFSASIVLGSSGEESGGGITVIPDGSLLIQIVNFIFLIFILNIILYKPIRNVLIQRKEKITGLEEGIEAFDRDAIEKEDAFASGIKAARADGLKEKEALLTAATEEESKIIEKINKKAQADLAEVRGKIAKDAEETKTTLLQEIDGFANAIGEKILGRAV